MQEWMLDFSITPIPPPLLSSAQRPLGKDLLNAKLVIAIIPITYLISSIFTTRLLNPDKISWNGINGSITFQQIQQNIFDSGNCSVYFNRPKILQMYVL